VDRALVTSIDFASLQNIGEKLLAQFLEFAPPLQQCEIFEILDVAPYHFRKHLKRLIDLGMVESFQQRRQTLYRFVGDIVGSERALDGKVSLQLFTVKVNAEKDGRWQTAGIRICCLPPAYCCLSPLPHKTREAGKKDDKSTALRTALRLRGSDVRFTAVTLGCVPTVEYIVH